MTTTTMRIPRAEQDEATRRAKALAHPLRATIVQKLSEGVASPNELSRSLGEPLGNVSYHVKALLELGCIQLVDTAPRRGAIEHYYELAADPRPDLTDWLPDAADRELLAAVLRDSLDDGGMCPDDVGRVVRMLGVLGADVAPLWLVALGADPELDDHACHGCGCTEDRACDGGCWWVAPGICSTCGEHLPPAVFSAAKARAREPIAL